MTKDQDNELHSERIASLSPEKQALLAKRLQQKRSAQAAGLNPISPRANKTEHPLSHSQQRMWFLSQWEPESPFYNISTIVQIEGDLDIAALARSFTEIVRRHEVLQAQFITKNGQPVQLIDPGMQIDLPVIDLSTLPADERGEQFKWVAHFEAQYSFDLRSGKLVRASLVKMAAQKFILFLTFHHIVSDGWSIGIFIRESALLYQAFSQGKSSPLLDLKIQYADYAAWQRDWLKGDRLNQQLAFWKEQLAGEDVFLELPTDYPRPNVQTFNGAYYKFNFPIELSDKLKQLARHEGVTLFMVLLAAFETLLHRYSGQHDIRVGSPIANRERPELEGIIGLFVNTLVMRGDFSGDPSFLEFLSRIRDMALGAYAHQDLPLELLLDELKVVRDLSRTPLFQVMFTLQEAPLQALDIPAAKFSILEPESGTAKFDLTLFMEEQPAGLAGAVEYNTDLFSKYTIAQMMRCLENILACIAADPSTKISQIPLLTQDEQRKIILDWNDTIRPYPDQESLGSLFEHQVVRTPNKIAVRSPLSSDLVCFHSSGAEATLTYHELNQQANQLAHHLETLGIGRDILVAIYMERSMVMVLATLAVIKAGGAYLPLDLNYPPDRLAFMIEDSRTPVIITTTELARSLPALEDQAIRVICLDRDFEQSAITAHSLENPQNQAGGKDLAYVMYTSGSTGIPKGVAIPQRAVTRLVIHTNYIKIEPEDRIGHASNPSFDAATFEIWGALLNGAELVIVSRETVLSPKDYATYLKSGVINTLFLTTALFNLLAHETSDAFINLKNLMFGGEQVDINSVRLVMKGGKPQHFLHVYGPTESTTFATWYEIFDVPDDARTVPIGVPLANSQVYVLDPNLQPVPIGVSGELYLGGDGLAKDYLHQTGLTEERFVPNPFATELSAYLHQRHPEIAHPLPIDRRLYKTGDRVQFVAGDEYGKDHQIVFIGRFDFQVKLRGLRIELGEIETSISRYPVIQETIVMLREDRPGDKRLVAYLVPKNGQLINLNELRQLIKEKLPDFMVPAVYVILDRMPLNPNGKVDRRALPAPDQSRPDLEKAYVAPRTSVEKYLVNHWQVVLGIDRIGIYDDFFELGGDSLKAAVLMNRLQEDLGTIAHVRALFMAPTIADLSLYMNEYYPEAVRKIQVATPTFGEQVTFVADEERGRSAQLIGEIERDHTLDETKIDLIRRIIKPLPPRLTKVRTKNPPAVFVLSPPRSGSTLLRTMLAGNPKLFSPPELDLLSFNTLAERRAAFSDTYSFWLEGVERAIMELRGCDAERARQIMADFENAGISTQEFYRIFQGWINASVPDGVRLLVDKTPVYALDLEILRRAEEDFDRPYYIHLMRHPFASIYSFIEAKLDGVFFRYDHPFTQRELAELVWIISHQNILTFLAEIPAERQLRMTFETMVNQPAEEMERICKFLEIHFDVGMLKPYDGDRMTSGVRPGAQMVGDFKFYLRKDIDPKAADRWKKFHGSDTLSPLGWEIAAQLGYETMKPEDAGEEPSTRARQRPVLPAITPIPRDQELPLSFAQQRLWFLDQWEPGNSFYNVPAAVRLQGRLNLPAMQQTLTEIVRRHEVLRTRFTQNEGKSQLVIDPPEVAHTIIPLQYIDIQDIAPEMRESEAQRLATIESRQPFDLSTGPLVRACLIQLDKNDCVVILTMHHIVSDGWSAGVIIREIASLYTSYSQRQPSALPELPVQYVDYAAWQRSWLQGDNLDLQLSYWKRKLANLPGLLELPTDRPRPAVQSLRGSRLLFEFPASLFESLKKYSQRQETTLFMTLLAAFQVLLSRYSGQTDICVGTPIANRNRAEIEGLIGFFVNTLVLRSDLAGNPTFHQLLAQVKQVALEGYDHQDVPFERLVDLLQPERVQSHTPLFQVMFTFQESSIQSLKLPGLTLTPVQIDIGAAKFDLIMTMIDRGDVLKGVLEYSTDLFAEETIARMVEHYRVLLGAILAEPTKGIEELVLISEAEKRKLLVEWNQTIDTAYPYGNVTIIDLFREQVSRTPAAIAVIYAGTSLSYAELDARSEYLGRFLQAAGVGPDVIVGLCLERSVEMIVGILGILKAGGAYLPLDPEYPRDRLSFILNDAKIGILITQEKLERELLENLAEGVEVGDLKVICLDRDWKDILKTNAFAEIVDGSPTARNLAYVIYTSGSTGKPKGMMIEHRSAVNLWQGLERAIYANHQGRRLRVSLNAPLLFDASVQEWLMLLSGHTLVVIPAEERQDGVRLLSYIREMQLDVLDCVPSQLKMLIGAGMLDDGGSVPQAILPGGEAIDAGTWETLARSKDVEFYNMYGPTECTVDSTICRVSSYPKQASIGRPIVNAQAYVLDGQLNPTPIGVAGELYLGGRGVGRGYLYRDELTAERFLQNPFEDYQVKEGLLLEPSDRLYKTGDLVRYLADGHLEYMGRIDYQVKLRGFRIELGEIESELMQAPGVAEAVVLVREDQPGEKQLVAYVVMDAPEMTLNVSALRSHLKNKLPEYMVPGIFVGVEQMPLTPNRKVDRKQLPKPEGVRPELGAEYLGPRTEAERVLAEIWGQVLKLDRVGVRDNFFDLGGDSILSIQVVSKANQMGLRLSPRQIFESQTIESLAVVAGVIPQIMAEQGPVTGTVGLTPIQLAFFEQQLINPDHWNQALLFEVRSPLDISILRQSFHQLIVHHDALRLRFLIPDAQGAVSAVIENIQVADQVDQCVRQIDLRVDSLDDKQREIEAIATEAQSSLNLVNGPLIQVRYINLGQSHPGRLLIVIHHLVIDGISWRILLQDLLTVYQQISQGRPAQLPAKTTSILVWSGKLAEYARSPEVLKLLDFWLDHPRHNQPRSAAGIPVDFPEGENLESSVSSIRASLSPQETKALLHFVPSAYNTEITDVLLTAFARAFAQWSGKRQVQITLEGHGREDIFSDIDITRTIGWFTTLYPVNLTINPSDDLGKDLVSVKEQLRQIPGKGFSYGLLRYLNPAGSELKDAPAGAISFNYLGQVDQDLPDDALIIPASEPVGPSHDLRETRSYLIDMISSVSQGQLRTEWLYSKNIHRPETLIALSQGFFDQLQRLIDHCTSPDALHSAAAGYSPSDFPDVELSQDEIIGLIDELGVGDE